MSKNTARQIGAKTPFFPQQIELIRMTLVAEGSLRDLALLQLGIDTMLRGTDLVSLRWDRLVDHEGRLIDVVVTKQQKTGKTVKAALTPPTMLHVANWRAAQKRIKEFVFPGQYGDGHLSIDRYRAAVKRWARIARLDPRLYSTHSIRKSKATAVYAATGSVEAVRQMLGHRDTSATSAYLGVGEAEVLDIARKIIL